MTPPSQPSPLSQIVWVAPLSPMPYIWLSSAHSGLYRRGPLGATDVHLPLLSIREFRPFRRQGADSPPYARRMSRRATVQGIRRAFGAAKGRSLNSDVRATSFCSARCRRRSVDRMRLCSSMSRIVGHPAVVAKTERKSIARLFLYRVSSLGGSGNCGSGSRSTTTAVAGGKLGAGERKLAIWGRF
jgi:hypothetical protein